MLDPETGRRPRKTRPQQVLESSRGFVAQRRLQTVERVLVGEAGVVCIETPPEKCASDAAPVCKSNFGRPIIAAAQCVEVHWLIFHTAQHTSKAGSAWSTYASWFS